MALVDSADDSGMRRAVREIAELGQGVAPMLVDRLRTASPKAAAVLAASLLTVDAAAGSAWVREMLRSDDPGRRAEAIPVLRLAANRAAMTILVDVVDKGPATVKDAACETLKQFARAGGLRVEDALAGRISGREEPFALAQLLAALGTEESRRQLRVLASSSDRANGQIAALQALALLGDQAAPDVFAKAVRSANTPAAIRQAAITAGKLRIGPAVPELIDALERDRHPEVTNDVAWALRAITGETLMADRALWLEWWESVGRLKNWENEPPAGR